MSRKNLAVDADLTIQHRAGDIRVHAEGGPIRVDLPLALWRARPSRRARRAGLARLDRALAFAGLTMDMHVAGRRVLRLGAERSVPWFARVLGLNPASAG